MRLRYVAEITRFSNSTKLMTDFMSRRLRRSPDLVNRKL
jgi:hypothetical protein